MSFNGSRLWMSFNGSFFNGSFGFGCVIANLWFSCICKGVVMLNRCLKEWTLDQSLGIRVLFCDYMPCPSIKSLAWVVPYNPYAFPTYLWVRSPIELRTTCALFVNYACRLGIRCFLMIPCQESIGPVDPQSS